MLKFVFRNGLKTFSYSPNRLCIRSFQQPREQALNLPIDTQALCDDICEELKSEQSGLSELSQYHFNGTGKAIRPTIIASVARCVNYHSKKSRYTNCLFWSSMLVFCGCINNAYLWLNFSELLDPQYKIAMIAEMIHTASLVHDDVIDLSDLRRGKPTVQKEYGQRKVLNAAAAKTMLTI